MKPAGCVVSRLRSRAAVAALFARGGSGAGRYVIARVLPGEADGPRAAVIAGRRLGHAPRRNRLRRRLRAAVRDLAGELPPAEIALVARSAAQPAYEDLKRDVRSAIRRAWKDATR